ncbi:unnamed protein product [Orchesella dallaii]|uniref:Uncharacterized protein n=1 Tax=Orchesella dallaii TaxID=48710 RepID=A0ABP1R1X3_9HEXA
MGCFKFTRRKPHHRRGVFMLRHPAPPVHSGGGFTDYSSHWRAELEAPPITLHMDGVEAPTL